MRFQSLLTKRKVFFMPNKYICPVCKTVLQPENDSPTGGDYDAFDCPRCGKYEVSHSLLVGIQDLLADEEKRAVLGYTIRKMQGGKEVPLLNSYSIEPILQNKLPSLSDQINNLILWLGDNSDVGDEVYRWIGLFQTIMGAKKRDGALFVMEYLNGNLIANIGSEEYPQIRLTMQGWEYYNQLTRGAIMSRKAFMAMKFGDADLDLIFTNYFKLAVKETGFDLYRLDEQPQAGLIDDRLRIEIRTSRFLIADLTHGNQGAYWEAGYAEGLGKHV